MSTSVCRASRARFDSDLPIPLSPVNENWSLDSLNLKDLMQGDLYINIHSTAFPSGEIRGQLRRQNVNIAMKMNGALANGGAGTGSPAVGIHCGNPKCRPQDTDYAHRA